MKISRKSAKQLRKACAKLLDAAERLLVEVDSSLNNTEYVEEGKKTLRQLRIKNGLGGKSRPKNKAA